MPTVVEAVDVVVGSKPSFRVSLSVGRGEAILLTHPPRAPVAPFLRILAGVDRPHEGVVHSRGARVALATMDDTEVLSTRPDLLVVAGGDDSGVEDLWALLARARADGVAVVASSSRTPPFSERVRVVLAMWTHADLRRELVSIRARAHNRVTELLEALHGATSADTRAMATDLRNLNHAARLFLDELARKAQTQEDAQAARMLAKEIAGESLSDRVLDGIIERARR
jgi:hypothetical protein